MTKTTSIEDELRREHFDPKTCKHCQYFVSNLGADGCQLGNQPQDECKILVNHLHLLP